MRIRFLLLAGTIVTLPSPVLAADQLQFGKIPDWVVPQSIPAPPERTKDQPAALLLHDQQTLLEHGKISTYSEIAFKIQKPEGLEAGNLTISWNPATDSVTVHKLEIHRGNQVIDVLASGQKFTSMRRETDLDLATLDGVLTAAIQPEGLQEGDTLVFETTTDHVDPVLKGHVEATFAPWANGQIALAHARLTWPSSLNLKIQKSGDLAAPLLSSREGRKTYELAMLETDPVITPKGAPVRFAIGRMGEATDFSSWSDAAALMKPLYDQAATIPSAGPLREEVEAIKKASNSPKDRAQAALALVQNRVRYVALLMGEGGYVPAPAETTWSRRFGDCKAKTALLVAILHEAGVEAEPVLVNTKIGDAIGERLPAIGLFNHVLVRAHIAGKLYWLDGTRAGDSSLDELETPNFGWGLPLTPNAALVHILPTARDRPDTERSIEVDATAGALAPANITITTKFRGDTAVYLNSINGQLSAAQREQWLREDASKYFEHFSVTSTSIQFDKATRVVTISQKGTTKLNWKDGWFYVPGGSIAYNPDFDRATGTHHDAPFVTSFPEFSLSKVRLHLPPGFAAQQKLPADVHDTVAGVIYSRTAKVEGNDIVVDSSERTVAAEVAYKDALAAAPRLKVLNNDDVYLRLVTDYRPSAGDLTALAAETPGTATDYVRRGNIYMDRGKITEALSDFNKALSLDPGNKLALADRAIAYVWSRKFDEADKDLRSVLASEPDNAVALRALALKAEITGDCAKAVDAYTNSLKTEAGNSFAIGHRALCEYELGHLREALADADTALTKDSKLGAMRLLRVQLLARNGQMGAATSEGERFIHDNLETAAPAWVALARAYAQAGLQEKAIEAFGRAIAVKPDASLYIARAAVRPRSDYAGRMADFDAALKLAPADSGAFAAKAELIARRGDLKAALAVYDEGMRLISGQSPLSLGRALLLYRMGRKAQAERSLALWRKGALTATELNEMCWGKATGGILLDSAAKDCDAALQINHDYAPAIDSLALVKLRLGKIEEAIALYDRAISKMPSAASYMGRALAYARKGDQQRAQNDREQALRKDPGVEALFGDYGLKLEAAAAGKAAAAGQSKAD